MGELFVPNPSRHDVSSFQILVEGKQIDPSYQVISISVSREVNRIPTAKIYIRDGEAAERDFEISNSDDFLPGKKIRIKIGLDGNTTRHLKGSSLSMPSKYPPMEIPCCRWNVSTQQ